MITLSLLMVLWSPQIGCRSQQDVIASYYRDVMMWETFFRSRNPVPRGVPSKALMSTSQAKKMGILSPCEYWKYIGMDDEFLEVVKCETVISRKEYRTVLEEKLTWSDRMREKFHREGREAGLIEGKRETLLRQLTAKFGPLSPDTIAKVVAIPSAAELDSHLERFVSATSLEEMGL